MASAMVLSSLQAVSNSKVAMMMESEMQAKGWLLLLLGSFYLNVMAMLCADRDGRLEENGTTMAGRTLFISRQNLLCGKSMLT